MNFIIRILISTLAVLLTCYLLPERMVSVTGFKGALIVALVLAFLNALVKPLLIVFAIGLTVATTRLLLPLLLLAINVLIILMADHFVDDFQVHGFWSALIFGLVLTVVNSVFNSIRKRDERQNGPPGPPPGF